jgi:hypothetical protein
LWVRPPVPCRAALLPIRTTCRPPDRMTGRRPRRPTPPARQQTGGGARLRSACSLLLPRVPGAGAVGDGREGRARPPARSPRWVTGEGVGPARAGRRSEWRLYALACVSLSTLFRWFCCRAINGQSINHPGRRAVPCEPARERARGRDDPAKVWSKPAGWSVLLRRAACYSLGFSDRRRPWRLG